MTLANNILFMDPITQEELAALGEKVKTGTASDEETIQYLDIVNGLSDEFLTALKSVPTDEELDKQE